LQQDIASRNGYSYRAKCAALTAGRIENESVIEYPDGDAFGAAPMSVVLIALTSFGAATVNARTHSMPSGADCSFCRDTANAGTSLNKSAQHHHNAHACPRCCCLGCASFANRAADCTPGVAPVSAIVSYGERINSLAGRILHPDPYPPRPSI
jgi:hypothetical protein